MNRRNWIKNILGGSAAVAATATGAHLLAQQGERRLGQRRERAEGNRPARTLTKYDNSHFYKADGTFNEQAAKEAFAELFRFHRYTLADVVDDERFWVVDFGLGDFANVGMGGIFWVNDKEHGYFGHEIYLLPFQMIPEHAHVPAEDKPAKHEYWQVRNGSIYNFSFGGSKDDPMPEGVSLPKSQLDADAITCFKWQELTPKTGMGKGEAVLNKVGEYHFMMGGPRGAIVTEYANYHAGPGLQLRNTKAKM